MHATMTDNKAFRDSLKATAVRLAYKALRGIVVSSNNSDAVLVICDDDPERRDPKVMSSVKEFRPDGGLDPDYTDMLSAAVREGFEKRPGVRSYPLLAGAFLECLLSQLGPEAFEEVCRLNSLEKERYVCRSHDFCDANMVMAQAWYNLGLGEPDLESQADTDLWNAAWDHANARMSASMK